MIKTEYLVINGTLFIKTFSTNGVKIKKYGTEEIYDEAIDKEGTFCMYIETDQSIDKGENK